MSFPLKSLLLLGLVIVGALAANASTAMADSSPASTAFTGTSANPQILYSSGVVTRCSSATVTGRTPARGTSSLSVALDFRTCTTVGFPSTITCRGFMTLRQTSFDPRTGSSVGIIQLDSGFDCTLTVPLGGCSVSFVGIQANVGTWNYTNGNQTLVVSAFNIAGTDTGGVCSGNTRANTRRGIVAYSGTYLFNVRVVES